MQSLDKIRQERKFEMFNQNSKDKVLELNSFFGKYIMHFQDRYTRTYTYYDTPNRDLEKSNIVVYKLQIGNTCELHMQTEKTTSTVRYTIRQNEKHFSKPVKVYENILKHKQFLVDNFSNMFMSSIIFDPEFLIKKLQVVYIIKSESTEYRSMNIGGLKITYSFDVDTYTNPENKVTVRDHNLVIYQHSSEKTNADFEDLISKLTRYCKELTPTEDTKIVRARKMTAQKQEYKKKPKQDTEKAKAKTKAKRPQF